LEGALQVITMTESTFLAALPADHYGVYVENDMDARRLLYLVEKIGDEKVTGSASRYSQKYPGTHIFVSELLKRYGIKVPSRVYAPVNIPVHRVYVLLHPASSTIKIGYSSNWIQRVSAFRCEFDLDRSVGTTFDSKSCALAAEKNVKRMFDWARTEPPAVPYSACGHKEWFSAAIYDEAVAAISTLNTQNKRKALTLRTAREHDIDRFGEVSSSAN
jgi:hypothetical protein